MSVSLDQALPFTGDPERTCPYCGSEEPNAWLLRNNHWVPSPFVECFGICIAMDLTRNHVRHDARQLAEAQEKDLDRCRISLARSVARAREVWPSTEWLPQVLAEATLS